jgi:hypothetical protein
MARDLNERLIFISGDRRSEIPDTWSSRSGWRIKLRHLLGAALFPLLVICEKEQRPLEDKKRIE